MDYLWFLARTVLLVVAGVVLANVVMATGILSRLTFITAPLCRASRLSEGCVFAILATTLSSTAGKSALATMYREGKLTEKEVICSVVMSTFPIVAGESLLRVQAPVALVLLGFVGVLYIILNLFAAFIQSVAALLYARIYLAPKAQKDTGEGHAPDCPSPSAGGEPHLSAPNGGGTLGGGAVAVGLKTSLPVLRSVLPILIITLAVAKLLDVVGLMDGMGALFAPAMSILQLPGECITAMVAQLLHFSAGYAVVASLLSEGTITNKHALLTLLLGSMVVITMINIRYSMPFNVSFFRGFGLKLTAVNYACSMGAKVVCIVLVLVLM